MGLRRYCFSQSSSTGLRRLRSEVADVSWPLASDGPWVELGDVSDWTVYSINLRSRVGVMSVFSSIDCVEHHDYISQMERGRKERRKEGFTGHRCVVCGLVSNQTPDV